MVFGPSPGAHGTPDPALGGPAALPKVPPAAVTSRPPTRPVPAHTARTVSSSVTRSRVFLVARRVLLVFYSPRRARDGRS